MKSALALTLLVALPVCMSYHYRLVQPFNMGNKRRTAEKVVRTYTKDLGACKDYIKSKNEWNTGMSFMFTVGAFDF